MCGDKIRRMVHQVGMGLVFSLGTTPAVWGMDVIKVDGSSTVYPLTEAVVEEFQTVHRGARVTIGVSGTGGGFKKFCHKETHMSGASRPIKQEEIASCSENGVRYIELPIAYDGLAVITHPQNDWAKTMTVGELKRLWEPAAQAKIMRWNQIRSGWPEKEINLLGPGADSGTFDYFTEAIVGRARSSRGDFTSSEDDNVIVQGVATDKYALGYLGLPYYEENKDRLQLMGIDKGKGPILPSRKTVQTGIYPLSRPLFIYVSLAALDNPTVLALTQFYLDKSPTLPAEVGYIALSKNVQTQVVKRFKKRQTGSLYRGGGQAGKSLEVLLGTVATLDK